MSILVSLMAEPGLSWSKTAPVVPASVPSDLHKTTPLADLRTIFPLVDLDNWFGLL